MSVEELEGRGVSLTDILEPLIEGKNLSDALEDCLVRSGLAMSYVRSTLVPKYLDAVKELLRDLMGVSDLTQILKRNLRLDQNWILAASCLSALDIAVARNTEELKISLVDGTAPSGARLYKNTGRLLREIREKLESQGFVPLKFRIFEAYTEEYRNRVVHGGIAIDRRTANQILEATKDLFTELALAKKS